MRNYHRQASLLSPVSPSLKKKASADPVVSLFLQLFILLTLTLLLLPFWLLFQAVLIQMHLSSLLVYLLFVVTAITGLRGNYTLRSKGITLLFGIAGIHVLANWLPALRSGHPFGVALYAYCTVFVVFGYHALFWWVAYRFILRASSPYRASATDSFSHKPGTSRGNQ